MQFIEGDGVFKPLGSGNTLPSDSWKLDIKENTIYIEGCKDPNYISSRPIGDIAFSYVLLPDFVADTDPVEVFAYSDSAYKDLVFQETKESGGGLEITREILQPGFLDLVEFSASSYYAFVKDVTYTVIIKPAHDMFTTTRVILTMPEHLTFQSCTVTYTDADCEYKVNTDTGAKEMILTNVFTERTAGGSELKFIISVGDNPVGARYAGNWGARTEGVFDGEYYIVDGN